MNKESIINKAVEVSLMEISNGEAHFSGFFEHNENDYGPHPLRYVELNAPEMSAKDLHEHAKHGGTLVDIEAEATQYVCDGEDDTDEATETLYRNEILSRRVINESQLKDGPLPDGEYAVIERHNEPTDEEWECQYCHKHFPATDDFGRVESDLGFLCHKCIEELTADGNELRWEDEQ